MHVYIHVCIVEKAAWEYMDKAFDNAANGLKRMNTTNNYANSTAAISSGSGSMSAMSFIDPDKHLTNIVNKQMRLITILPGIMLGPHLGGTINYSHRYLLVYLENRIRGILNVYLPIADVRDVAACHILTMESYRTEGSRYCLTNKSVHMVNILQTIHENFVDIKLPARKVR